MATPEANEKKIETLTKIARLLSDQVREQNNKIALLQKEIATLKLTFGQSAQPTPISKVTSTDLARQSTSSSQPSTVPEDFLTSPVLSSQPAIAPTDISEKNDSEKKELLEALKIIDNL